MAAGKFMEQFFIQCFVLVFRSRGQEDVATDELVHHFAVTAQAAEGYRHVLVKFYGHLKLHTRDEGSESLK